MSSEFDTDPPDDAERTISSPAGTFQGVATPHVLSWRGIRYAVAPTGELRWRDPLPAPPEINTVIAAEFGNACPQQTEPAMRLGDGVVMDEDCLTLNIWAPRLPRTAPRPVMVWIHGGAYVFGSSSQPLFNAAALVNHGDVVVVTINYRLGAFGFLDLPTLLPEGGFDHNLALKDVLLALRWVHRNIAAFGGDPDRVTVFGESAGAGIATALLATPTAAGLFSRAIIQSAPVSSMHGLERARAVAERFVGELGLDPTDHEGCIAGLRHASAADIVTAGMKVYDAIPDQYPGTLAFAPVIDGEIIPESPIRVLHEGRGLPVPLMIGTNKDEASLFTLMKSPLLPLTDLSIAQMFSALADENPTVDLPSVAEIRSAYSAFRHRSRNLAVARDIAFRVPTLWAAEGHCAVADVWLYRFDHASPFLKLVGLGATHGSELPYLWGNLSDGPKDPTFRLGGRGAAEKIASRIQERWTAFAHGHTPNVTQLRDEPEWLPYRTSGQGARHSLIIGRHDAPVTDLDEALRELWGDEVLFFH